MKKVLIFGAVLCAASGAAMAQNCAGPCLMSGGSAVSLYGVADAAIGNVKSIGKEKTGMLANTFANNGNGRIGVMGREDLGGGQWAGFRIEGNVSLADGAGGSWTRYSFVSLGGNNWGTLMLGRNMTPGYDAQMTYDLTRGVNYSIIGLTYGWGGSPDGGRSNGQIEYLTPVFSGLSAEVAYNLKGDGALVNDGVANKTDRWMMNVVYNQGPIKAAITADKLSKSNTGGNTNKTSFTVGGSYTFNNIFSMSVSYNHANSAQYWHGTPLGKNARWGKRRFGLEFGGSFFSGPYTLTLDLTRDTKNELYGGKKYTNGVLEGKYALSKRTFLYVVYIRLDGDNNYALGVRHNF